MMFRRLYWVTEQANAAGAWRVTGVYTSVSDLVDSGLRWVGNGPGTAFRLSLVKLDSAGDVLATWSSPGFEGLSEGFEPYIRTGEFTDDDRKALSEALRGFMGAPSR